MTMSERSEQAEAASDGETVLLKRMMVGSVTYEAIDRWITERETAGKAIDLYDRDTVTALAKTIRDALLSEGLA